MKPPIDPESVRYALGKISEGGRMTNDELKLQSWDREAHDVIIPELSKLFKKRRWEAESVAIALRFFLEDVKVQFPGVVGGDEV